MRLVIITLFTLLMIPAAWAAGPPKPTVPTFAQWWAWRSSINLNRTFEQPTTDLTCQIVNFQGQIVPGQLTFDIGYFDNDGVYYPEKTRSLTLAVPAELQTIVAELLDLSIDQHEGHLQALVDAIWDTPEMQNQWDGKHND